MPIGISTSTQIPDPVRIFYDRVLLNRALPFLAHNLFGQQKPVDPKAGDQPKFRRYTALPKATSPLVEGITPQAQQLQKTDITGQLVQYGQYVTITDYVDMTSRDPVITESVKLLGESAGQSLDEIYRDTLVAGTNVFYTGTATVRTAVKAIITATAIDKVIRQMSINNAKFWREQPIVGMDRVGTLPIASAFYAIISPQVFFTLKGITGFVQTHEYPNPTMAVPGEVGAYNQMRFVQTTQAKVFAGGGAASTEDVAETGTVADVHAILVFGQEAYGITPLGGKTFETIVKPRGAGEDALDQRSTAGWKATTDIVILNDAFMFRMETAVST